MTQSKSVTTAEPLVKGKEEGKRKKYERGVMSTQRNQIFSSKAEAIRELLTAKAKATYEWLADLASLQHLRAHLRLTFSCHSLHVWTDRCGNFWSVSPMLLWTAFVKGVCGKYSLMPLMSVIFMRVSVRMETVGQKESRFVFSSS